METPVSPEDPRIDQFWECYFETLQLFRVPDKSLPWYRKHIETFIDYTPNIRLVNRDSVNVEQWLNQLGRNPNLSDWQFRQQVDALRLLFCHRLKLSWAADFDWAYWSYGATRLEADHVTTARTYESIDEAVNKPANYVAQSFPEILRRFLVAIRIPEYSINTEKSYPGWINRFLRFHQGFLPHHLSEPEVASFLEYLALKRKVAGATQSRALGQIGPYQRPVLSALTRIINRLPTMP